ncbi:MAG: transglycosylase domain-containing protein [Deltaproteobacteria bacterium]|nr:transglycosylase domain-containing protein [Deltaproteobacteria bacterium]
MKPLSFPPLDPAPPSSSRAVRPRLSELAEPVESAELVSIEAPVEPLTVRNPRRGGWWRDLLRLALAGTGLAVTGALMAAGLLYTALAHDLPRLDTFDRMVGQGVTRFEAADGSLVGEQYAERRLAVAWTDLPRPLVLAFLAAEDARFFEHGGVDFRGILRAMVTNLFAGSLKEGASTITQQLVKILVGNERSYVRKVKEAILARRLEDLYSKEQILAWYLNVIYLGHNSYGVQAAAQSYFRKNVWELTLAECAMLAGVPQSPSRRNPFVDFAGARRRMDHVLGNMLDNGWITQAEADAARAEAIKVWPLRDVWGDGVPEYAEAVRRAADVWDEPGPDGVGWRERGLGITMAVEPASQRVAAASLQAGLEALQKKQGFPGPLGRVPDERREAFLKKNARWLPAELAPGARVLARVATVDKAEARLEITAERAGVLPLANASWAAPYTELPLLPDGSRDRSARVSFGGKLEDLTLALAPGDVVLVEVVAPPKPKAEAKPKPKPAAKPKPKPKPPSKPKKKGVEPEKVAAPAATAAPLHLALVPVPLVEGALVATGLWDEGIEALVGGWDFDRSEVDRTRSVRKTGSAIKPLVYGKAYDDGLVPSARTLATLYVDPETGWEVAGSSKVAFRTAWDGLVYSENAVTVRLFERVLGGRSDEDVAAWDAWGRALGLDRPLQGNLAESLGAEQTPRGMLAAFTTFARDGRRAGMHLVKKVVDRGGHILERRFTPVDPRADAADALDALWRAATATAPPAIAPTTAHIVAKNLEAGVQRGTGGAAKGIGRAAAGKTGTMDYDVWFCGFTGDRAAVVWIGADRNERTLGPSERHNDVYGSDTAAPVWAAYMKGVDVVDKGARRPGIGDDAPPDVVTVQIDPATGLLARDGGVPIVHRKGTEPVEAAPEILDPEL